MPDTSKRELRDRRWLHPVLAAVVGALAAVAGVGIVPAATGPTGPTEVSLRLVPGTGETRLRLTPLGTVGADTHVAPARIELSLVEADLEALARAATSPVGRADLRDEVQDDLTRLAVRAGIYNVTGVALVALAVVAIVLGRAVTVLAAAVGGALLGSAAIALMIVTTFDLSAFEQPSYSGALTKAQQVVDVVARGGEVLDQARSRFDVASDRLSQLLVLLARPDPNPREAGTVLLHVSDIHANPIGFEIAQQLAEEFAVDAIVDTGDLASAELDTGAISSAIGPVDAAIAREIRRTGVPYLYVAGNHDSPQLRQRVAAVPNVQVLDGTAAAVGSLEIMGWADPTFSTTPIPEDEKRQRRLEMAPEVGEEVSLTQPDVVAVHDPVLATNAIGSVPVVIAGHRHARSEVHEDGTLVLTVGSTGATGLKHLTLEAGRDYEAQVLYFQGTTLVALDYLSFADLGGDFELSRRTYDAVAGGSLRPGE